MGKRFLYIAILVLAVPCLASAGTAYIPLWNHGGGVIFYTNIYNDDTASLYAEINLVDTISSSTYTYSQVIPPKSVWISDTGSHSLPPFGFGWGFVRTTGTPGKAYAYGAIYGTTGGKVVGLNVPILESGFSGTAYIPIWQHGYGVSYVNSMINADTKPVAAQINLIDTATSTTYMDTATIASEDAWMFDTLSGPTTPVMPSFGYGWGYLTSTGAAGTTYAYGAIYGTLGGKIVGLSVLIPQSGF